jgi:putative drug exporter of the RND superfamily
MLERLGSFCFRRRRSVVVAWILALPLAFVLSGVVGGEFAAQQTSNIDADSQRAIDLLQREFPEMASQGRGETGEIVFEVAPGGLTGRRAEIDAFLARVEANPHVDTVISPFDTGRGGRISSDGTIGVATVSFHEGTNLERDPQELVALAEEPRSQGITTEFSGQVFAVFELPPSEIFGLLAAVVILLVAFGSVVAMGLPILTALLGVGISIAIVGLWAAVVDMASFVTSLTAMIGLGVGIDYVLFLVTRYRDELRTRSPHDAVVRAMGTAGRAVLFAGITVVISMLGMFLMGLSFINGIALAGATPVAVIVAAALTLLPALLGFTGHNINRLSVHRRPRDEAKETVWHRWSRALQRRAWPAAVGGFAVLLLAAVPVLSLRLGFSDQGNDQEDYTTRRAYDLQAKGFGPGSNGPFLIATDAAQAQPAVVDALVGEIRALDAGIAFVSPPTLSADGRSAFFTVVPTTAPQDEATTDLLRRLRDDVIPTATEGTSLRAYVGGFTASGVDFSALMGRRLPYFIATVLVLSFLLLMAVFRSVLVPLKAVVMNLLSIGAAYGLIVAVFQKGWGASLVGVGRPGPIEPWIPMMLFAIVFGLSMDYEVFLLSKIKEEYDRRRDNSAAVVEGLASTARVITAAALIMVCVFGAFALGDNRAIKLMGLGLATAVFIDATIVRVVLVPATMELLGERNWWFPSWLDRLVPRVHVEGGELDDEDPALEPVG